MFNKHLLLLETRKDTKKDYMCIMCKKSCKSDLSLKKHLNWHSAMKTFLCTICGHQSTNSCHLEQHMRIHTGARPFKCEICDKTFSQKANLTRHKRIHSGEKPFVCEICGKAFIESGKLSKHLRVHLGQKNYHCSKCGKQFAENRNLTQHMLIHSGEKPHKCLICDRSFRYPSDLKEHKSVHSKEKPYVCIICDKSFKSVRNLKKHTKFLHTISKDSENGNELQTSYLGDYDKIDTGNQISKDNTCEIIKPANSAMSEHWPPARQMSCAPTISNTFSNLQTSLIENDSNLQTSLIENDSGLQPLAYASVHVAKHPKQKEVNINETLLIQPPGVRSSSQYESSMIIQEKVNPHMTTEQSILNSSFQTTSSQAFSSSTISHIHVDDRVFIDISQSHPHTFPSQSYSVHENYSNTMELTCDSNKESNHLLDVQTCSGGLDVLNNLPVDEHLQTAAESLLDLGEGCLNIDSSIDSHKYHVNHDNRQICSEKEHLESGEKVTYLKSACIADTNQSFGNETKTDMQYYEVESESADQSFEFGNAPKADHQDSSPIAMESDCDFLLPGNKDNSPTATINDTNESCPKPATGFANTLDTEATFGDNTVHNSLSTNQTVTNIKSHQEKDKETSNIRTSKSCAKKFIENIHENIVKVDNSFVEERNERRKFENRAQKELQFECTTCNRFFRHKGSLRQHQQVHYYEEQGSKASTKCPTCSKVFSKPSNLNQHLKIHIGIRSFRCEVCSKTFLLRHSLLSHQKTHSEEKPHACRRCPRKFKFKQDLVNHNRIHTGIKPYQCAECGKTFSLNSTLNRHLRTHSGARPYSCNLCGRDFSQNGNMHQHMKTHLTLGK